MSKRRKKQDSNFISAAVGVVVFLLFAYRKQLQSISAIILMAVVGAVVVGLVVFLRHSLRAKAVPRKLPTFHSMEPVPASSQDGMVDKEFERQLNSRKEPEDSKPAAWSLELLRSLDWKRFEDLCAAYFQAKGRNAKVTNLGADGGVDVLLYGDNNPNKVLGVVQCKAWAEKPVGVREIRELLGVMTDVGCPLGVYVTTSGYTADAQEFAKGKHIKLMNASQLLALIQKLPSETQSRLLEQTVAGDYKTPSCPSCGIKLVSRTVQRGERSGQKFWGCRNYPRCRYTMHGRTI